MSSASSPVGRVAAFAATAAIAVASAVAVPPAGEAQAAPVPAFTDLGTLGEGAIVDPADINDDGLVVGIASTEAAAPSADQAFFWHPAFGMRELPGLGGSFSEAILVNDANRVAGVAEDAGGDIHVAIWDIDLASGVASVVDAGNPGPGFPLVADLNDVGVVVGTVDTEADPGTARGFRWTDDAGLELLATLGGPISSATAISEQGAIVGISDTTAGDQHATAWFETPGVATDLGTLGGTTSAANDVSDGGFITGVSTTAAGVLHGFFWAPDGGLVDVGSIGDDPSTGAFFTTDDEIVVEVCGGCGTASAWTWNPTDRQLRPVGSLGGLTLARSSSAAGLIVGSSATTADPDALLHPFVAGAFWPAPTIRDLVPPFADEGGFGDAINDRGIVVGTYFTSDNNHGRGFVVDLGAAPDPPTGLAATATSSSVALSWSAPDWPGAAAIATYRVRRDGQFIGESGSPATSFVDDFVVPGATYRYEVVAVNEVATSASSSAIVVTVAVASAPVAAPVVVTPSFTG